VVRVPFLDLLDEIGRGTVRDSLTVATAYKAYHMAQNGALPPALAQAMLGRV
jgi:TctA family transporter